MPKSIHGAVAVSLSRNLYIIGGDEPNENARTTSSYEDGKARSAILNTTFRFDTISEKWEELTPTTTPRRGAAAVSVTRGPKEGAIVLCGGYNEVDGCLASCEQYNEKTNEWTPFPNMTEKRHLFGMALWGNSLFAFGGWDRQWKKRTDTIERFRKGYRMWTTLKNAKLPAPRSAFAVVPSRFGGGTLSVYLLEAPSQKW